MRSRLASLAASIGSSCGIQLEERGFLRGLEAVLLQALRWWPPPHKRAALPAVRGLSVPGAHWGEVVHIGLELEAGQLGHFLLDQPVLFARASYRRCAGPHLLVHFFFLNIAY